MSWNEAQSQVFADSLAEFGEAVSYLTEGGDTIPLPSGGIFARQFKESDPETGVPITTTAPNLVVLEEEWPDDWQATIQHVQVAGFELSIFDVRKFSNPHALRIVLS